MRTQSLCVSHYMDIMCVCVCERERERIGVSIAMSFAASPTQRSVRPANALTWGTSAKPANVLTAHEALGLPQCETRRCAEHRNSGSAKPANVPTAHFSLHVSACSFFQEGMRGVCVCSCRGMCGVRACSSRPMCVDTISKNN